MHHVEGDKWRVENTLRKNLDFHTYGPEADVKARIGKQAQDWKERAADSLRLYIPEWHSDPKVRSRKAMAGEMHGRPIGPTGAALLEQLKEPRTQAELREATGFNQLTVQNFVQQQVTRGRLVKNGWGKKARYVIQENRNALGSDSGARESASGTLGDD